MRVANVEAGEAGCEDTGRAMRAILDELATRARLSLGDGFVDSVWLDVLARSGPDAALRQVLIRWAQADPRPLVLFLDEIDALVGDTLLSVLRQLRSAYDLRPAAFPQSVVLVECKVVRGDLDRTIRDGVAQTADYMDRCGAEPGHLVVFDRGNRSWSERIFHCTAPAQGAEIHVWGL